MNEHQGLVWLFGSHFYISLYLWWIISNLRAFITIHLERWDHRLIVFQNWNDISFLMGNCEIFQTIYLTYSPVYHFLFRSIFHFFHFVNRSYHFVTAKVRPQPKGSPRQHTLDVVVSLWKSASGEISSPNCSPGSFRCNCRFWEVSDLSSQMCSQVTFVLFCISWSACLWFHHFFTLIGWSIPTPKCLLK